MNRWTTIACFVATLISNVAQGQTVDATIDRNEILIGEQAEVSLSVNYPKDRIPEVIFPQTADTLLDKVEVLRSTSIDTLTTGADVASARLEKKLFITSFDSGYYAIPPFTFIVNGDTQTTEAFLLTVHTVAIDTTGDPKNIKDIYEVEVTWGDYFAIYRPYILGGLALLVAILVGIWFLRRNLRKRRTRPAPEPVTHVRPADETAREELDRIEREKIYCRGLVKRYHTEITDVVRDYLEAAAHVPAHELTTRQIMQRLRYSGLSEREAGQLREVLLRADMVKFAREEPSEDENLAAVRHAREFVESTSPRWMNPQKDENEPTA